MLLITTSIGRTGMGSLWYPMRAGKCKPDEAILLYTTSLLSSAREEIDRADSKASILLAASGVATGALLAGLMAGNWTPLETPGDDSMGMVAGSFRSSYWCLLPCFGCLSSRANK